MCGLGARQWGASELGRVFGGSDAVSVSCVWPSTSGSGVGLVTSAGEGPDGGGVVVHPGAPAGVARGEVVAGAVVQGLVLPVSGHRTDRPQFGEPPVAPTPYADQLCRAHRGGSGRGAAQFGHDGNVGGVPVFFDHRPEREASRTGIDRGPRAKLRSCGGDDEGSPSSAAASLLQKHGTAVVRQTGR